MDKPSICGCICISPTKKVLCVKGRSSGKWSFPKGHRNPEESPSQCARRELWEETGLEAPTLCQRVLPLSTGLYYVYATPETQCDPQDTAEVSEVGWFSLSELAFLNKNLDMNTFLWNYSSMLSKAQRMPYKIPQIGNDDPLDAEHVYRARLWRTAEC